MLSASDMISFQSRPFLQHLSKEFNHITYVGELQPLPQLLPGRTLQAVTLAHDLPLLAVVAHQTLLSLLLVLGGEIPWNVWHHLTSYFERHSCIFDRFVFKVFLHFSKVLIPNFFQLLRTL